MKQDISLREYTTFKIGGPAKFFVEVATEDDLKQAVEHANKNSLKYFILAGGSNILISDKGFDGLVIKINFNNLEIKGNKVVVGAGVVLEALIKKTIENSLAGLEVLAKIPGTVGGAIYGNAGSFGKAIGDFIKQVKVYNVESEKIEEFNQTECQFEYRGSDFKKQKNLIIIKTEFELPSGDKEQLEKDYQKNVKYKQNAFEWQPSAGCVFKNIELKNLSNEEADRLEQKGLDLTKAREVGKISAGQLIDFLDLKGLKVGEALISDKHANFIINIGQATAEDVIMLESIIKQKVRNSFGIQLELEQILVGF